MGFCLGLCCAPYVDCCCLIAKRELEFALSWPSTSIRQHIYKQDEFHRKINQLTPQLVFVYVQVANFSAQQHYFLIIESTSGVNVGGWWCLQ